MTLLRRVSTFRGAALLVALLLSPCSFAQFPTEAWVTVRQELLADGRAAYHYRVINKSEQRIVAFVVGYNYLLGEPELMQFPEGWTFDDGAPAGLLAAPAQWTPEVIVTEESEQFEVQFRNTGDPAADVFPGKSLSGFSVIVPRPSPEYTNSHFMIIFGDSSVNCDRILREGAPQLSVELESSPRMREERFVLALNLSNLGTRDAKEITLSKLTLRTTSGTGTAVIERPALPIRVGDLALGGSTTVALHVYVPRTIRQLSIAEHGTFQDPAGAELSFSGSHVMNRKLTTP